MDYDDMRAEREFRQNPPSGAPGQGDDDGWGDIFSSEPTGSSSVESNLYGSDINQTLNSMSGLNTPIGVNMQQSEQPNGQKKEIEDVLFDTSVVMGKGIWSFSKALIQSFKDNKSGDWHRLGIRITKISALGVVLGIIFCVLKLFISNNNQPLDLVIGSFLSMMVGISLCMLFDKEPQNDSIEEDTDDFSFSEEDLGTDDEDSDWSDFLESNDVEQESFEDDFESEDKFDDFNDEETDWDDFLEDEDNFVDESSNGVNSEDFSVDEALENVPEIVKGTQTRQFLFESFMKVLPKVNPQFSDMRQISADENLFYDFEDMLRSAAYQVGTKEEYIPELETLFENDFIYRLNCTRPTGLKEQQIADEIANTYSRDEMNRVKLHGVYATVETSVGKYTVNIFKGFETDAMGNQLGGVIVSLADIYNYIKQFICNPDIKMPLVWGVNEFGEPMFCDMIGTNAVIISGLPRGGKSWLGQSIVAQFCMFLSPKEIEIYIFDGKDTSSDYRYLSTVLPHVRYFCGNMDKINDGIEKVLNMVVDVRGKQLQESGEINISDYNKKHPENKMPYTYIIIDELMSLMEHFNVSGQKEEKARFNSFLSTMVSKLPNLGVRFIMFPHRIVNDIISKNTYSLVPCRAVVKQTNKEEVKNATGATDKGFPYNLAAVGDMALKTDGINSGEVSFCHAGILTNDNAGNRRLFEYIGGIWRKLEPDCECITINGSIGGKIGNNVDTKSVNSKGRDVKKPVRDNTQGEESFEYTGFGSGSSVEDINDLKEDIEELAEDSDFWDSFS